MAYVRSRYNKTKGIVTNLYTKGGEYADPLMRANNEYRGPYHTIYGIPYKGEEPQQRNGQLYPTRLIPITRDENKFVYNDLKRLDYAKDWPGIVAMPPTITQEDEDRGWYMKYMAKYLPSGEFMEIDKAQYDLLIEGKNPHTELYETGFMKWKIRGFLFDVIKKGVIQEYGIADTNRRSIQIAEDTIQGLSEYLTDLLQYARPDEQQNLYTDGTQLVDDNDVFYEGAYHIHKEAGPMAGALHKPFPHKRLYPVTQYIPPKSEEFRVKQTPQTAYNSITGGMGSGGGMSSGGGGGY